MTPSETLDTIVSCRFFPITNPSQQVTIEHFDNLRSIDLSLGNEIEIEGFVTFVPSHIGERDKDLHFELFPHINDGTEQSPRKNSRYPVICEIQNALEDHHQPLMNAKNSKRVRVKGQFRLFLEHIQDGPGQFPHIFEVHPVTHVWIEDMGELDNITVDAPNHEQWAESISIYEMVKQSGVDGFTFINHKENKQFPGIREDIITATYAQESAILKFGNITSPHNFPGVGFNYVFSKGKFIKNAEHEPEQGKPYTFPLEIDNDTKITCVVYPETPASSIVTEFHQNPPDKILALALRSMNMNRLYQNKFEIILSPVFRLEEVTT
jgi:hypothetical protein